MSFITAEEAKDILARKAEGTERILESIRSQLERIQTELTTIEKLTVDSGIVEADGGIVEITFNEKFLKEPVFLALGKYETPKPTVPYGKIGGAKISISPPKVMETPSVPPPTIPCISIRKPMIKTAELSLETAEISVPKLKLKGMSYTPKTRFLSIDVGRIYANIRKHPTIYIPDKISLPPVSTEALRETINNQFKSPYWKHLHIFRIIKKDIINAIYEGVMFAIGQSYKAMGHLWSNYARQSMRTLVESILNYVDQLVLNLLRVDDKVLTQSQEIIERAKKEVIDKINAHILDAESQMNNIMVLLMQSINASLQVMGDIVTNGILSRVNRALSSLVDEINKEFGVFVGQTQASLRAHTDYLNKTLATMSTNIASISTNLASSVASKVNAAIMSIVGQINKVNEKQAKELSKKLAEIIHKITDAGFSTALLETVNLTTNGATVKMPAKGKIFWLAIGVTRVKR